MNKLRKFQYLLPLSVLFLSAIACGSTNTGEKVGTSAPASTLAPAATSAPMATATPTKSIFTVGDIVEVEDHIIVLNSIEYSNSIVKANILVENNGSSDINVSSIMSFSTKSDDGTKLEQEIFDCGNSLDGSILPGDRLLGDICYSLPTAGSFKIYYEANLFSSGAVVWQFDANSLPAAAEVPAPKAISTTNTFAVGDVVQLPDQTITLNSVEIVNNLLKANFTVENIGAEDVNVSSLMSFNAKAPDGTKLEQEIFSCGTSMDGSVLPGDKLKGDICYNTAGATPIKLYYTANLYSDGAVVWVVE